MKKITLFAVAALAASSAFAANPVMVGAEKPQAQRMVEKAVHTTEAVASLKAVNSRAGETISPAASPTYVAPETFYIGLSREWMGYGNVNFGICPAQGKVGFLNLSGAQESSWTGIFLDYMNGSDSLMTATTNNFFVTTSPATAFTEVNLVSDNISYCDSVYRYYAGDAEWWGFIDTDDESLEAGDYTPDQVFGVIPTAFRGGRGTVGASAVNKNPGQALANYYQENGTYASWAELMPDYTDIALNGYGFYLPQTGSSYLLSSMYLPVSYILKEDLTVFFNVYAVDENGYPTDKLLGKGNAILPAGNTAVMDPVSGAYMLSVNLRAVNELNIATTSPVVVDQPVYIAMTGIDSDVVTSFNICICIGTNVPKDDYNEQTGPYWHTLYPSQADVIFNATDAEGNPVVNHSEDFRWVFSFSGGDFDGKYVIPSTYFAFYNITYNYVENAIIGQDGFDYEAPIEGGETLFVLDSNQDIAQLYDDLFIDASASADWVDFEVGVVENGGNVFSAVKVTATEMPSDIEGRQATIDFKGYACDFTINVTQGVVSSINEVVAAKAKNGKVFDLQGRAVKNATKGIYIVDGKKTILR